METRRWLVATVTALLLMIPGSVVVAQDESPGPDPAAALTGTDFADVFPTELGGLPWNEIVVAVGSENLEDQDLEQVAETEALLERLGVGIDDISTAVASRFSEDFSEFTFMWAFKIAGAEGDRLRDELVSTFAADVSAPREEVGQIAGKEVVLLYDDDFTSATGEARPFYFYVNGDTVWMVNAPEPELTEAFEKLP